LREEPLADLEDLDEAFLSFSGDLVEDFLEEEDFLSFSDMFVSRIKKR